MNRDRARGVVVVDATANVELTAAELRRRVDQVRDALRDAGVVEGQVVLVQLPNCWQFVALEQSLAELGAVIAPIPTVWRRADVTEAVDSTGAAWLVTHADHLPQGAIRTVELSASVHLVKLDAPTGGRGATDGVGSAADLPHLLAWSVQEHATRWVAHSRRSADASLARCADIWGIGPSDTVLVAAAVGFLAGFQWGCRLAAHLGARQVLVAEWEPLRVTEMIHEHGCTFTYGTRRHLVDLLDVGDGPLGIRLFALAAAQPDHELVRAAEERGCAIVPTLSFPESFLVATCGPQESIDVRCTTRGRALPDTTFGTDSRGVLVVDGPQVAPGYLDDLGPGERRFTAPGRLLTGDRVELDAAGLVRWSGPVTPVINRSGIALSPAEIERIVVAHPDVVSASVSAKPHPRHGDAIAAHLTLRPGADLDVDGLRRFVAARGHATYKAPDVISVGSSS